jgi:hypothetical protein
MIDLLVREKFQMRGLGLAGRAHASVCPSSAPAAQRPAAVPRSQIKDDTFFMLRHGLCERDLHVVADLHPFQLRRVGQRLVATHASAIGAKLASSDCCRP